MALDLGRLLAPVSDEDPTGPDLAYDPARYEIEQAFETEVSIDASGVEASPSEVDWRAIVERIVEQSDRTKDLWLAAYLCRAGARAGQLDTVEVGAKTLSGLLEAYWPTVHPRLEEYGFQGRKGPCDSLVSQAQFIAPLRKITLINHPRLGRYSIDDFERFRLGGESEEGYGMFRAALEDLQGEGLGEIVARLNAIEDGLRRADLALTANADESGATNFKAAYEALGQMRRAVQGVQPGARTGRNPGTFGAAARCIVKLFKRGCRRVADRDAGSGGPGSRCAQRLLSAQGAGTPDPFPDAARTGVGGFGLHVDFGRYRSREP
ncbi:ImpA family type VI secretion system protein [Caulobacter segnis]